MFLERKRESDIRRQELSELETQEIAEDDRRAVGGSPGDAGIRRQR